MKNLKVHQGGKDAVDLAKGVDLGAPRPTIVTPVDLLTRGVLKDGVNYFFAGEGPDPWGKFGKDRDILGVTVLAAGKGGGWIPLPMAHVVLRVKPNLPMLDQYTRSDGSTLPLPFLAVPNPTPLGQFLHAPIKAGAEWRLEVEAPGFTTAKVHVILHTNQADPAPRA
jgi:hypothetical protein